MNLMQMLKVVLCWNNNHNLLSSAILNTTYRISHLMPLHDCMQAIPQWATDRTSLSAWHRHHIASVLVMLYTTVWELLSLNVKPRFSSVPPGIYRIVPRSGHTHILPNLFHFIILQSSYHSILYSVRYWQHTVKYTTKKIERYYCAPQHAMWPVMSVWQPNPIKTGFLPNNIYKCSLYLTGNTLRLHYKAQPVNAVWENSRCLLWEP
jgi:hypothetical protein